MEFENITLFLIERNVFALKNTESNFILQKELLEIAEFACSFKPYLTVVKDTVNEDRRGFVTTNLQAVLYAISQKLVTYLDPYVANLVEGSVTNFKEHLDQRINREVVIYHGGCTDGTMAAAIHMYFTETEEGQNVYVPGTHGISDTFYFGCKIYFLDFAYNAEDTQKLIDQGNEVIIIDHHVSNIKALQNIHCSKFLSEGNTESGAMLTWMYFAEGEPAPKIIDYISQRDTWTFHKEDGHLLSVLAYFDLIEKTPEAYESFLFNLVNFEKAWYEKAVTIGSGILQYQQRVVRDIVDKQVRVGEFLTFANVAIVNCPGEFASDVGSTIMQEMDVDFAVMYSISPRGIKFSLRSKDSKQDVSHIAKIISLKGGGHRNAAGVYVSVEDTRNFEVFLKKLTESH